jgi:lipopolysaccharide transport system permease protein
MVVLVNMIHSRPELIIKAGRTERHYWRDIWRYRELFYFLAWRDILVRYKQTVIGMAWALIRPFMTMIVFSVVFGGSTLPNFSLCRDATLAIFC